MFSQICSTNFGIAQFVNIAEHSRRKHIDRYPIFYAPLARFSFGCLYLLKLAQLFPFIAAFHNIKSSTSHLCQFHLLSIFFSSDESILVNEEQQQLFTSIKYLALLTTRTLCSLTIDEASSSVWMLLVLKFMNKSFRTSQLVDEGSYMFRDCSFFSSHHCPV